MLKASTASGDIIQRIDDHRRVQQFLSNSTLDVLFSAVNIIIFGAVPLHYNLRLFLVFLIGSSIYLTWVLMFMRKRAELEYKRFDEATRARRQQRTQDHGKYGGTSTRAAPLWW